MMGSSKARERRVANFGVPWEDAYGYAQAVEVDGVIYVSGQVSHDRDGTLIAPAPLDSARRPTSYSNTEAQLRRSYENAASLPGAAGRPDMVRYPRGKLLASWGTRDWLTHEASLQLA